VTLYLQQNSKVSYPENLRVWGGVFPMHQKKKIPKRKKSVQKSAPQLRLIFLLMEVDEREERGKEIVQ